MFEIFFVNANVIISGEMFIYATVTHDANYINKLLIYHLCTYNDLLLVIEQVPGNMYLIYYETVCV